MNTAAQGRKDIAAIWILGINLLVACAAQVAATIALLQDLAGSAAAR